MLHDSAKNVLIVEDEVLVAMDLEQMLSTLGYLDVKIATRVSQAMLSATQDSIKFAILDINVAGENSFAVADVLRRRGIPFVFTTGYGSRDLVDGYPDARVVRKPYGAKELEEALNDCVRVPLH